MTDEGRTLCGNPFAGNRGKLSPHPALRGHLLPQGEKASGLLLWNMNLRDGDVFIVDGLVLLRGLGDVAVGNLAGVDLGQGNIVTVDTVKDDDGNDTYRPTEEAAITINSVTITTYSSAEDNGLDTVG